MSIDDTELKDSTSEGGESPPEPTLADTVQAAVDKAVLGMESRMKQSARDTARFEASKTKPDDVVSTAVREALGGKLLEGGESVSSYLDAAERDAELKRYREADKQAVTEQQRTTDMAAPYYSFLEASGIDRNDPRLDWAPDETDQKKALGRWHESITKIKTGTAKKEEPKPKADDPENFVPTDAVSGIPDGIPKTKAAVAKFYEEASSEDIAKLGPEIDKALFSGQMKD